MAEATSRLETVLKESRRFAPPEEFRKRVLKGLGGPADPLLREAVKRYAEGLLK